MRTVPGEARVLLIGGSSHAGKSSLGAWLARALGGECVSTDALGRHPGRPWQDDGSEVPVQVAEHYRRLSPDALLADVLAYYDSLWPRIEGLVRDHLTRPGSGCLVVEGSALWPASVPDLLGFEGVACLWLTAGREVFRDRIHTESRIDLLAPRERDLVAQFLERTLLFDARMMAIVRELGLPSIEVEAEMPVAELGAAVLGTGRQR